MSNDKKKGVSQSDLYQVVSYAYRRGCNEVILIYPNVSEEIRTVNHFEIPSGFDSNQIIQVTVAEIPFWSIANFANIAEGLKKSLTEILI